LSKRESKAKRREREREGERKREKERERERLREKERLLCGFDDEGEVLLVLCGEDIRVREHKALVHSATKQSLRVRVQLHSRCGGSGGG
jgi:hypothetical protein